MGLKDAFRSAAEMPHEDVDVPGVGLVRVLGLTIGQRDRFEEQMLGADGTPEIDKVRAKLLVKVCHDPETGDRIFSDEDIEEVDGWPSTLLEPLVEAAQRVCGFTSKSLEALAKN